MPLPPEDLTAADLADILREALERSVLASQLALDTRIPEVVFCAVRRAVRELALAEDYCPEREDVGCGPAQLYRLPSEKRPRALSKRYRAGQWEPEERR